VELDLLLTEVFTEMRVLARNRVLVHLNEIDQVIVNGDRDRLKQVFLNLVSNAIQYTPSGGEIFLSLNKIGDQGRVIVRDTGPGIPAEDLPHIFERFYRASTDTEGTGLGLAIVREVARTCGASVALAENPHGPQGLLATVRFPESEVRNTSTPSQAAAFSRSGVARM